MSSEGNMSIWPPQNAVKGRVNHNPISFLEGCILLKGDSQTFVEALLKGSSKQMSFLYLVFTNFGQKMFFLPFSRFFLHQKNLASFLVILVQVCFASQESQKSLYRGLPHHFGIVQSWSLRSENFRGLGSQENSGRCLEWPQNYIR